MKKNQLSARGKARYDKILDVATEIFFEHGFEKCSLNDVVKKAGGSLATLYKYFGNKEGLLLGILERKVDLFYEQCNYGTQKRTHCLFSANSLG